MASTPIIMEPSSSTDTIVSPRPTATEPKTSIFSEGWQPQPSILTPGIPEPIVAACEATTSPEYYFLDTQTPYELRDIQAGLNLSLTNLELSGFYYLDGRPVSGFQTLLTASFGGREMEPTMWRSNGRCAAFTFITRTNSDAPTVETSGRLFLTDSDSLFPLPILITSAEVTLQRQLPVATSPTFGGGVASTVDSSIGQDTNQTPAPASGNVPVTPSASSQSSSPKASVLAPAIVVPIVVVLAALAAFFLWRRHRRARLAPSAAFRADHADAVEAIHRQGGTVGLGGTGTSQVPTAGVSLPSQSSSYFPLDEKRPLGP